MGLGFGGNAVEGSINIGAVVALAATHAETAKQSGTIACAVEQSMKIGTRHASVGRCGAICASLDLDIGSAMIRAICSSDMDLIALERDIMSNRSRAAVGEALLRLHDRGHVEQPQPLDFPNIPFDAMRITDRTPEHLIPAADADDPSAAADMH